MSTLHDDLAAAKAEFAEADAAFHAAKDARLTARKKRDALQGYADELAAAHAAAAPSESRHSSDEDTPDSDATALTGW